jgi:PAS domain S-box-containing protein
MAKRKGKTGRGGESKIAPEANGTSADFVEQLRLSEERYRTLVQNLSVGVFRTTPDHSGRFLQVNAAHVAMLGYSSEAELMQVPVSHLYHDPARRAEFLAELKNAGSLRNREVRLCRKDGGTIWASLTATARFAPDGSIQWIDGILEDVSAQKRMQEDLHKSYRFLSDLLEILPIPVFYKDAEGIYRGCNTAFEKHFGVSRESIVGRTVHQTWAREVADIFYRKDQELFRNPGLQIYEARTFSSDGTEHIVIFHKATFQNPDGSVGGLVGAIQDITELRRVTEAHIAAEAALRALLDASPERAFLMDANGNLVIANEALAGTFGMPVADMPGKNVFDLLPPDVSQRRKIRLVEMMRTGNPDLLVDEHGGRILESHVYPVRDTQGRITRIAIFARDITDQRRAEEQLRSLHHNIVSAREMERRRLAAELHDSIGQGLIVLRLAMEHCLSERKPWMDESAVSNINGGIGKCTDLVNEVRRIVHGLYPPALETLGLCAAIRQLGSESAAAAEIHVDCGELPTSLRFNPDVEIALFRVAQEALANAIRHAQARHIDISLRHADGRLILRVANDGGPFEPISGEAHGLGLRSMRERAEGLGGSLRIAREDGRTVLTAEIPAKPLA